MSKYRNAIRLLFIAVLALPLSAFGANYDVKAFIDTDNSRTTGCSVSLPDGTTSTGFDTILTTSVSVTGTTGTVTAVTRQTCSGGVFGGPVPVDNGWAVGVSPTGDLLIESHLGPNILTMHNVGTPRFVFTTTSGLLSDLLLQPTSTGGGDIIMPHASRDRAVTLLPLRTIVLNGDGSDWAGDVPLALGTANQPALRFISVNGYAGASDFYFNFKIHTNPAAPTAHDDVYDLPTLGGTLSVATLGVLNNDVPNGQSISAVLVDNPLHGALTLNPNGGFVYSNDGAHVTQDQFHYFANGLLPSNIATVTITMPGTKYVFTSPDHVFFTTAIPNSFTVTVTGKPTPALSEDGALPSGITFVDNGDGTATLSGTPGPGTTGIYPLVFHAEKNKPHQADQAFTLFIGGCPTVTVTNPAQSSFPAGVPMSATFTQSAGAPPITWSKIGTLPPGLTFNTSTGVLSGTPTQSGTFPITVTATDASGCSGTGPTYNLTITCPTITVTNPVVNTGTVNVPFSQTFTQSGGFGVTTFSLNSGTLPAGLTLASSGTLSGTPTQSGSFPITVKATDSHGCTGISGTYTLTIGCQVITVTNPVTNTGTVNVPFSQTFTAGNTIGAVTFSLNSGTLPAGLTLSSGGVLSGTPTQTGSFPITVKATDANGCSGVGATYTLTIGCQVITVNNPATNTGTVNVPFSQTFTAGNTVGAVTFTLNSGTLPAGITLSSGGVLSGTPTQKGSFPITVKATDANGCTGTGGTYTLTIGCQVITVTNPATNTGTVNVAFSQTFTAGNTIGATTFTTASALPTGLTLSTGGVLSGTPTQKGTFPIVVTVTDANGCSGSGATYNLTINCQTITVTNPATNTGTVNVAFSQTFTSGNTIGAVTYSTASALPTGLTLSAGGVLSGTPTQSGSFPIVVTATDANGCSGSGATYNLTIGCQVITVTNPVPNTGTVNTAFSQTFTAGNTIGAVTFSLNSGTLPAGLTLSTGGVLSGTPTQTGSFPITVKATDANGCFGIGATYTLTIGCQVISVTNPATTTGTVNAAFSQTFTAGNTVGTVTFTTASALPAGLSLSSGGVLSGTPTQTGSFGIVVTATDGNGCSGSGSTYTLVIGCQTISVTNPANNTGTVSAPFSETFTSGNTIGTVTYTLNSGSLPAGLSLSTGGIVGGTPTQPGSFPITVKATDANGCFGISATYTINIACQVITVNNPATTSSPAGTPLSINFTQSGAIGTPTFTTASTLPTGLTLDPDGTLHGTPTQSGPFSIAVTVTDANGCTGTNPSYTLTLTCPTITVTNPATTTGTVNVAFSQTFTQTGGVGTTTFSLFSGTLPTGMTFHSATGVLDGTPTQSGSFNLVIRATDSNGCTGDGPTYNLVIGCQVITVTNPVTNTGTVNTPFSQTFTAGNTIGAVTFSLNSGTLPAGITLSTGGVLSGTPTQTGPFAITVKATDANGCSGIGATYTLTIGCQVISVTNPATTTGTVNTPFSQTFTASNTVGTVSFTTASSLPAGLTLSTAGVLSGTPTQSGSFGIVVTATDGNGCSGSGSTYTLVIGCQTITVTNPVNNTGTVSAPFSETFTSGNTIGTVTYTLNSGSLPAGLSLSTGGILGGTPTQSGSFPITVKATDANGCFGVGATYTINIACQVITVNNPATTSSPAGTPLSINFTQSGAIGTATFTTASTLPTGLTLDPDGTLHGTPTQGGSFGIAVTVTDSNGCTGTNPPYTLTITCPTITVTNPGVTTGTAGTAFSQTFTQTGGQGTVTFAIHTGTLPTGMTFHSATGVLDGTPTQTGSFPIVVRATDSNGCTGDGPSYPLVIGCQTITVNNPVTTGGTVNAAFSQTFTQSGAIGGATFSLNSGSLPAGLTLSSGGVLSGTPTQSGSFPITVKVTDGNACTGIGATYTLVIACQTITVTNPSSSTGTIQVALTPASSYTFSAANTIGAVTFALNSGSLPAGISLTSGGVLTGTPTVTGSFPITVQATDGNGCFGVSPTYTLVINCQTITVTNPAATTATVGTSFSDTFAQTGANGTATFTLNTGSLPTGITLASNGALSGIPTQSGSFTITVKVTDSNACTGISPSYTLVVSCQTITVTNPATTTGTVGTAFSQTFTQSGGIGTITWSEVGSIPAGMTFHTATGVLDGTPTASGSFPITVTATDQNSCTGTGPTYTLAIACNVINVSNPGVTTGTVDAAFSQSFTQTGANGTATFTLNSGSLPAGFSLSSAGVLSGTPGAPSSSSFTVKVTDSNGCTGVSPTYTLVISCQTITVNNPGITTGTVDAPFSQSFTQTGVGTHTPATFSLNSGSLAGTGLTLSSAGLLSGTPTAPATIAITVKVTDANGCTGISATYTLVISCQTITVTNPGTSAGIFNTAFSQTFTQSGVGTHTPANFSINSGTLPTGLSLSTAGVLSGTPTQTGSFPITVKVTDSNGCTGIGATYNLAIAPKVSGDSYAAGSNIVDNTQFVITGGTTTTPATPAVTSSTNILTNDLPAGLTATPGTFATTAGGSVTIAADGTFIYTPKVNSAAAATTSDSFTYTAVSNGVTSAPATVSLTLTNRVWYVKNNGAAGNGQSQSPFNTLVAAQTASLAGDIIFVYNGDGTTTNQTAGITLKANQQLIGEGVALVVNTVVLKAAGTKPQISNTTAASDAVTINDGNTVKGLTITGATRDGISSVVTHAGFTADTLTIQNNTSSGLHLTSMTGTVTVTNATISGNATGLDVNNGTAAITLDNTNTITSGAAGRTVSIQNRPVSAGTIALGATINDAGTGILVNNNASGTINFTGSQTPNVGGANTAVNLTTNTGTTINFSGTLNATSATGSAFNATGGGTLNVTGTANVTTGAAGTGVNINAVTVGASGVTFNSVNTTGATTGVSLTSLGNGNVTINGGTISGGTTGLSLNTLGTSTVTLAGVTLTGSTTAISGTTFGTLSIGAAVNVSGATALNLATGAVTGTFANVSSTGGTNGVNLNAVTGTWGATAGSLTGATGATFNVTGGSGGTISWGATINQAGGANAVTIASSNSNTINFSANVTTSGTSTGISISGSTGTYNFTGAASTITGTGGGITISSEASGTISFGSGTSINGATNTFSVTSSSANITYGGTITDNVNGGTLLNIATYSTGTLTMNGTSLSGNVNGINGVISTLSAITGTVVINNLSLTSGNNNFSNTLVAITGVNTGGSITFNHLTLSATGTGHTGKGLTMVGNGTLAITATGGASSIDVSSTALDLNGQALGASALATLNSSGGVNGILLTNVTGGTMTITGGTIAGNTGGAFVVSGGTPSVSYGGTITQNTAGQRAVDLQTRTGGTITFSGLITSSGGNGVFMNNAAGGSTTVFSGGLTLSTGAADAFTATGGGIVNVSGTNNVTTAAGKGINWNTDTSSTGVTFNNVTSTTGAAVTIVSSGGSNFTFNDITSTTGTAVTVTTATGVFSFHKISSNGAAKGITVSALTGTGSFTVTGTGGSGLCDSTHIGATDCQGGTIQGGTTRGAEFNNARAVTLNNMYFKGNGTTAVACGDDVSGSSNTTCDAAIYLVTAASPTLNKIYVDGTGSNDSGIIGNAVSAMTVATLEIANFTNVAKTPFNFQNLTGTTGVTGLNVHNNSGLHNVMITNNTGTANITLTSPTLTSNSGSGNPDQLQVNSYIAGTTLNVTATNVNITASSANTGNGVMFQANSGSSMTSILNGGVVTGTNGLLMQETGTNTTFNFTVTGLTSVTTHNLGSNAITVGKANGTNGVFTGTVTNNVITSATCGGGCAGIKVASFGVSGASTVNVSSNNISGVDAQGIWIVGGQGGSSLTATVQANNIHNPVGSPNTSYAIDVYPGTTSGDAVCFALNLGDMTAAHTVSANRNTITGTWQSGGNPIEAAIFNSSTFKLLNYSGSTDANAAAWIAASNGGLGTDAFHLGTNQFTSGASCP